MHRLVCLLFCVLVTVSSLHAKDDEPIVVCLSTESKLLPVYISPLARNNAAYDDKYLGQIEGVLNFDLSHNGMTRVVARSKPLDAMPAYNAPAWKAANVYYIVKGQVDGSTLSVQVISCNNGVVNKSTPTTLSGDLSKDRRRVHEIADSIHRALFNKDGVATTKFLYTVKRRPNNSRDSYQWISEVWEADYDGMNARQITSEGSLCVTPVYIPPKKGAASASYFLYVSYKTGEPKICLANVADGRGKKFISLQGNQLMPAVSLQRDKICFVCDVTGNPDIFVQPFSTEAGALGKARQVFSAPYATQGSPIFSPDGSKICFVSNKDGAARIYVMDVPPPGASVKTLKPKLLTRRNGENTAPAWSPDGTKIAYCAMSHDGSRQIWVVDLQNGEEHQLTKGGGIKENPSWAPDSLHLIFNSATQNTSELFLVNMNQPDAVKISSGPGEKRFPSWQPRF